jgi:hypothetical protein
MDVFALEVLERTLELAVDTMPPERDPAVAVAVDVIRRSIESSNSEDRADLYQGMSQLAKLALENRQFLIAARLKAFVQEMKAERLGHDVA